MSLVSLVLAAGKGTRMKSELPKVLHRVNGIPMIKKILDELNKLKTEKNILVLGHKKETVLEELGDVDYTVQDEQLGTGHAVMMAKDKLENFDGTLLVTCGDTPLLRAETLKKLYEKHVESGSATTVLTSIYENPFGYGRIVKDEGVVKAIVEEKEATEEIKNIKEVNAGVYCFDSKKLFQALNKIDNKNENGEYYLTDVIKVQVEAGEKIDSFILEDNTEILGVNSKAQLAQAGEVLRMRKILELMDEGVIFIDPKATYIEEEVKIDSDTVVYPGVIIEGKSVIGKNVRLIGNTRIENCEIHDNVRIESSVVEKSIIEADVTIGPFAHIRPKSHLKASVHIGNFVETKNSTLERGVKAGHLSYLGDAHVGEETNIGAGTITCNYDGKNKHKTVIGKKAFIGSDTMLVAPVEVGDNAITGAGSTITKDIPSNALGLARAKQIIKKEWSKK